MVLFSNNQEILTDLLSKFHPAGVQGGKILVFHT